VSPFTRSFGAARGEDQVGSAPRHAQAAADVDAVESRQCEIEEHEVDVGLRAALAASRPSDAVSTVKPLCEQVDERLAEGALVSTTRMRTMTC
jgi:hypothetical protein